MKIGKGSKIYKTAKIVTGKGREIIIGKNCLISDYAFIAARKFVMEDGSQISVHAIISGGGDVHIGKFSVVGFGAMLIPSTDRPEAQFMCEAAPKEKRKCIHGSITLGEGVYISSKAIICVSPKCPHIKIGDYAVIGAGSYIDKSVLPYTIIYPKVECIRKRREFKK